MKLLNVLYHGFSGDKPVMMGRLAWHDRRAWFEFSAEFLQRDTNPSPFSLDLTTILQKAPLEPFNGLHGLFSDSLPDGWGLYLMDKVFRQTGRDPAVVTPLDRLAYMGRRAMGAISYEPDEMENAERHMGMKLDIDIVGNEATRLYQGGLSEVLEHHAVNGTPSAGARPKILIGLRGDTAIEGAGDLPSEYSHWLVKFPTSQTPDKKSEGTIEYIYAVMARHAGSDMSETRLSQARDGNAYFMTRRFDRTSGNRRHHVHSVAGMLNTDFRGANFEYKELIKLCGMLTHSHSEKVELFRRMIFNIVTGNRDDHTKNFAFMLTDKNEWVNTPAYDVTWNQGMMGEHTMSINGKGKDVCLDDILNIAKSASISKQDVSSVVQSVMEAVSDWNNLALQYDVPSEQRQNIHQYMSRQQTALSAVTVSVTPAEKDIPRMQDTSDKDDVPGSSMKP